jgi:hypothetical protein
MEIPYRKLHIFREWLGLGAAEFARLDSVKDFFAVRKEEFARFLYDFFMKIPDAKFIIEHQERAGYLLEVWAHWFESLFSRHLDQEFLGYLWNVGMRHVEVNLDQRFSNLGFARMREFCQKQVSAGFPPEEAEEDRRKIFPPFYSIKPKGTGFGLSIAQKAVRKNMGRIRIEPVENAGTRVVLSLPLYMEGGE